MMCLLGTMPELISENIIKKIIIIKAKLPSLST